MNVDRNVHVRRLYTCVKEQQHQQLRGAMNIINYQQWSDEHLSFIQMMMTCFLSQQHSTAHCVCHEASSDIIILQSILSTVRYVLPVVSRHRSSTITLHCSLHSNSASCFVLQYFAKCPARLCARSAARYIMALATVVIAAANLKRRNLIEASLKRAVCKTRRTTRTRWVA